ncbi:MAG: C1 family peptidase [Betaproteobacteria bacterium]
MKKSFDPVLREKSAPIHIRQRLEAIRSLSRKKGLHFEVGYTAPFDFPLSVITGLRVPADVADLVKRQNMKISALHVEARSLQTASACAAAIRFDWREQHGATPIRDQGNCGSCWAYAALGALEGAFAVGAQRQINGSEQQLIDCSGAGDCDGGWWAPALEYLENREANATEANYPYTAANGSCSRTTPREYSVVSWGFVPSELNLFSPNFLRPPVNQLKEALCLHGPLAVGVNATDAFQAYAGGAFDENDDGHVNHAVTLIGWDDAVSTAFGKGVWIIKNSWGQWWGEAAGYDVHTHPMLVADVNGDGKADLVFMGQDWAGAATGLTIRTKLSNGDGTWRAVEQVLGDGSGTLTHPVLVADVNGDGKADLVFMGQDWRP